MAQTTAHVTFHLGYNERVLFDYWKIETKQELVVSCLIVVVACCMMEILTTVRKQITDAAIKPSDGGLASEQRNVWVLLFGRLLQVGHLFIGYCLVAVFMTLNGWLCLAVVGGQVIAIVGLRVLPPAFQRNTLAT
ncbi:Protein Y58A7A.1 a [Aphelenchoides avenae]|nr:Protein Y58A7A.1 a [Aphelenchus avenae]